MRVVRLSQRALRAILSAAFIVLTALAAPADAHTPGPEDPTHAHIESGPPTTLFFVSISLFIAFVVLYAWRRSARRTHRSVGRLLRGPIILLAGVAAIVVQFAQNLAVAHNPNDTARAWSCIGDNDGSNNACYMHWNVGQSARWAFSTVGAPPTAWHSTIRTAAAVWNGAGGSPLAVQELASGDYVSIRAATTCDPAQIGCANLILDWGNKHVVGGTITISNGYWINWYVGTGSPSNSQYDLASLVAHETGHAFAGGHSASEPTAVMWGTLGFGEMRRYPTFWDGVGPCQSYGHAHSLWGANCWCPK